MSSPSPGARWQRLWELFHAAADREGTAQAVFLAEACAGDPDLQRELERLLAAHAREEALLDRPAAGAIPSTGGSPGGAREEPDVAGDLPPGEVLAGRFEIVGRRGAGGMGVVYEALDRELGSRVALKMLLPAAAADPEARQRFRQEVALARRVTHPNACRLFDLYQHCGPAGELTFVTMELVTGETLAARLARRGPFDPAELLPLLEQVAAALDAAHREGVIHRDLKPANVMLVGDGATARAVVMDFGIARALDADHGSAVTAAGQLLGTPAYMAPEQLLGQPATPATDVYGFGVMVYELLTGVVPHSGVTPMAAALERLSAEPPTPRRHRPDVDARWERVVQRCLAPRAADRFPSPTAAVRALRRGGDGTSRRWARWTTVAVALVAAGAGLALLLARLAAHRDAAAAPPREPPLVLVAGFDNHTGDELLEGTVAYALQRELAASRFVRVATPDRVADALRLMKLPPETPLGRDVAREVALRDGAVSAVVSGRVDRLGTTYALGAELLDPASGDVLAVLSEEAASQEEVLAAVARLAAQARATLGERLPPAAGAGLAHATTRSLPALRLFTGGERLIADGKPAAAEELLRQAVTADPDFASAWMYLAFAIRNQRRGSEEWLPPSHRALALAPTAHEREAGFIRASVASMEEDWERAIAGYEALLSLYPDEFWAHSNLARLYESLDRHLEAVPHSVAISRLRPNLLWPHQRAAEALAIWQKEPAAAEHYLQRAQTLLPYAAATPATALAEAWLAGYPIHRLWVAGRRAEAVARLRSLEASLPALPLVQRSNHLWVLAHLQRACGRYAAADALFAQLYPPPRRAHHATMAFLSGGPAAALPHLEEDFLDSPPVRRYEPLRLALLARAGRHAAATDGLAALLPGPQGEAARAALPRQAVLGPLAPFGALAVVRGEIALAEGDLERAVRLLENGLREEQPSGSGLYFLGATGLADAYVRRGDPARAIEALERAGANRQRSFLGGEVFWAWGQWRLAQLYRQVGRAAEAAAVERDLRGLLGLAAADPWPWRER